MPSRQQTLEQKRAARAWHDVTNALNDAKRAVETALQEQKTEKQREELKKIRDRLYSIDGGEKFKGAYGTLARKTPAMIMSAGLGQTLAFLRAKGKKQWWDEHNILYIHLSEWVSKRLADTGGDLLDVVRQNGSDVYRMAIAEALAFLSWLKRFAEAELPEADGSEG